VPDRTSAPWWQRHVPRADLVLFVAPKIKFINQDGRPNKSPAQGTCLLAIGPRGVEALHRAEGKLGVLMTPCRGKVLAHEDRNRVVSRAAGVAPSDLLHV